MSNILTDMTHTSSATGAARPSERKALLVDWAARLFNQQGYHNTGIDQILKESGVAKATLYKYFKSKEDLILAVLEKRHDTVMAHLNHYLEQFPEKGVMALFDAYQHWFSQPDFQGCNYIHAGAEYGTAKGTAQHAIHRYAAQHKDSVKNLICEVLERQFGPSERSNARLNTLAEQLLLVLDGAIISAHLRQNPRAITQAKAIALCLLSPQN